MCDSRGEGIFEQPLRWCSTQCLSVATLLSNGVGSSLSERPGIFSQVFLQKPDLRLGYIEIPQSEIDVYPVRQREIQAALVERMAGFQLVDGHRAGMCIHQCVEHNWKLDVQKCQL